MFLSRTLGLLWSAGDDEKPVASFSAIATIDVPGAQLDASRPSSAYIPVYLQKNCALRIVSNAVDGTTAAVTRFFRDTLSYMVKPSDDNNSFRLKPTAVLEQPIGAPLATMDLEFKVLDPSILTEDVQHIVLSALIDRSMSCFVDGVCKDLNMGTAQELSKIAFASTVRNQTHNVIPQKMPDHILQRCNKEERQMVEEEEANLLSQYEANLKESKSVLNIELSQVLDTKKYPGLTDIVALNVASAYLSRTLKDQRTKLPSQISLPENPTRLDTVFMQANYDPDTVMPSQMASAWVEELVAKPWDCSYAGCPRRFEHYWQLEAHLLQHINKRIPCGKDECILRFDSEKARRQHHADAHSDKRNHACPECDKTFKRADHLKSHFKIQHSGAGRTFKCDEVGCAYTEIGFGTEQEMIHHIARIHLNLRAFKCTDPDCRRSKVGFNIPEELAVHRKWHSDQRVHNCYNPGCFRAVPGNGFTNQGQLRSHMKSHEERNKLYCPVWDCLSRHTGKTYATEASLRAHVKNMHPNGTQHKCPDAYCKKIFDSFKEAMDHLVNDHKNLRFFCPDDTCFRSKHGFSRKEHRDTHVETHEDCAWDVYCLDDGCPRGKKGRGFRDEDQRDFHMQLHTDKTPFYCIVPGCHRRSKWGFKTRQYFNKHMTDDHPEIDRALYKDIKPLDDEFDEESFSKHISSLPIASTSGSVQSAPSTSRSVQSAPSTSKSTSPSLKRVTSPLPPQRPAKKRSVVSRSVPSAPLASLDTNENTNWSWRGEGSNARLVGGRRDRYGPIKNSAAVEDERTEED